MLPGARLNYERCARLINFAQTAKTILTTALFPETMEVHELLDK